VALEPRDKETMVVEEDMKTIIQVEAVVVQVL
jgi:hypothetical protein